MKSTIASAGAAVLCLSGQALAQDRASPKPAEQAALAETPFQTGAVTDQQLGAIAGRADVLEVVNAQNSSNVSNNRVEGHSVTGDIAFDPSAFSDMNGLALVSANSGNNVSINASLNVNVSIRP